MTDLELTLANRKVLYAYLVNYSTEELNTIPPGQSNNLIWNIGHTIVIQQLLVYQLSGNKLLIPAEMVGLYNRGTIPTGTTSEAEIEMIKSLVCNTIEQTSADLAAGKFSNYTTYQTLLGIPLEKVEDAIKFNNFHEALHLAFCLKIKKGLR
ncbi:DinB family protein [Flavobacterium aurantiibacter]|uniref:DinB-like domain-containing protein n=1 Tax=Flavobacterium aurantiibacter TaxID=2023067 RepID=A0A255ZAY3_9FLAO|nr:DinB family protein [Flavobacterium aurantiibacter]OYQ38581.1 hypothetical protein CHX27_14420 [Flavobacterium aurantiibacter]